MNIGIEIEFTGVTTKDVAYALENLWGTYYKSELDDKHPGRTKYIIHDSKEKEWIICEDHSLRPTRGMEVLSNQDYTYMCELVTPVLDTENLSELFKVMALITNMGGVTNETCGCHIHIDNKEDDIEWLNALFTKALTEQHSIFEALGTSVKRSRYCKLYPNDFIQKYKELDVKTIHEFKCFLYKELGEKRSWDAIRNPARYYWLNMDSIEKRNTIEFRAFNSTLSPIVIQAYVDFIKHFIKGEEI